MGKKIWLSEYVDDVVDIIISSEDFKQKVILSNNKRSTDTEVYEKELMAKASFIPFSIMQLRTKFKWCVNTCRKVVLTMQTVTGIKNFVEDKGFGKWFNAFFPTIKSRNSCQPGQTIRPSSSTSGSTTPVGELTESEVDTVKTEENSPIFVPVRKRKWCCQNSLLINPDKTKILLVGIPQLLWQLPQMSILLLGKEIRSIPVAKDLSLYIDQSLTYN